MKVAGYIRVSTGEQAENGNSLDSQEQQIVRSILTRDWQLLDVYRDEGESAKTLDRPELQKALELIAARKADGLMVAKLDRLTRNVGDFVQLVAWFEQADAALIALDLNVDTSTPGGKAMAQIFAVFAEWEHSMISQRTRDALQAIRASGRPISGPRVEDRPELAERIRDLYGEGLSYKAICDVLNAQNVPTARGGSRWHTSALKAVLGAPQKSSVRRQIGLPRIARR